MVTASPYDRAMARRLVSPRLIGRETELAAILHALDGSAAGAPVHQLIAGEAGVGKTRLVSEAASIATARGMRVLVGGCADIGDGGVPYGPIVEALRSLVRELDSETLDGIVGASRRDLARLVPSLSPDIPLDDGAQSQALQARLLDALLGLIQRLAEAAPVVLVVEDLHWADPATRDTIAFLARNLRSDRAILVATFRADELHRRHPLLPWLAELERSGRVERLVVERLDAARTRQLLAAILDAPPDSELVERIHARSEGNPFFIEELLMAGQDGAANRMPPTLREILMTRIVALPEQTQAVIGVAAVAGRRVDHDLLARVAAMDEADLLEALRSAVGNQVLVTGSAMDHEAGDYAFRHALLQEAAYDDLLPGERQRLHRAFAEALSERGEGTGAVAAGHWAELAYHWSSARDDRRAFEASLLAGEAATRTYAFADARRHHERALELWSTIDDPSSLAGIDLVELLHRAATVAWLAGDPRRAVALRRQAIAALGPDDDLIRVGTMLEQLGRSLWNNGDAQEALEAAESAVAIMPAEPPTPERARVLSGYGQMLMVLDRWSESQAICEQAVAMARRTGTRQAEGHALNTLGLDLAAVGRCGEAISSLEKAIEIGREVANPDDIGRAYVNLAEATLYCGDVRGALDVVHRGIVASDEVGLGRTYGRYIRDQGVQIAFDIGKWDEGVRLAEESLEFVGSSRLERVHTIARWAPLLVARGDARAPEYLAELRTLMDGYPVEMQFNGPYRESQAEAALWNGDPDAALDLIRTGLAEVENGRGRWYHRRLFRVAFRAAAEVADVARARRDHDREREAIEIGSEIWTSLEPLIPTIRASESEAAVEQADAELATIAAERSRINGERASSSWRDAAARWRARENPYLRAYCLWRDAEALLGDGDRPTASTVLAEAHAIATMLEARPLSAAIESLATRARLDLAARDRTPVIEPAAPAADPFGLTRRERDVLPLLVKGRTNRQIADELFISENTAGVHVSNILGKLGASTRTEAAGIAAKLGLGLD